MTYRASIDAAYAVVGFVSREWGDHGYSLSIEGDGGLGAIAHVRHTDGSEFTVCSDRWGNVMIPVD